MSEEFFKTLPPTVGRVLGSFIEEAQRAFALDLRAIVLYGSAADGQLRPTSDVNLLIVLTAFDRQKADEIRAPLRLAEASIRLRTMFLLESELPQAMAAFAVKFADIVRRRRVLFGKDPFAGNNIKRGDSVVRLKQTLLNLTLRLREAYVVRGQRDEQLVRIIADTAGPLRSCAATLLELEGRAVDSPKNALRQVAGSLPNGPARTEDVARISEAREKQTLDQGVAALTLFGLIELARSMWVRADALS